MSTCKSIEKKQRTNLVTPVFADGMVVTADDLNAASAHPADLMRTLVRAAFGCGIVCGLRVTLNPDNDEARGPDANSLQIRLHPGTALDCVGNPLQICEDIVFDFKRDPCDCKPSTPEEVFIAVARCVVEEPAESDDCTDPCADTSATGSRRRDYVRVRAFSSSEFTELQSVCILSDEDLRMMELRQKERDPCDCLKQCLPCCTPCCDSWVFLARVVLDHEACQVKTIDQRWRRYIKPTHCLCGPDGIWERDDARIAKETVLKRRKKSAEEKPESTSTET